MASMESLNLNNLVNTLPTSGLANAEAELMSNFKAAALSITTLYKSSRRTSKRAYNAGYAAACQELLLMVQQGVSTGESNDVNGGGMTIGRIMDYIEARLEAIKSREEEEDEDEERDRERDRARPPAASLSKNHTIGSTRHPSTGPLNKARDDLLPITPRSPSVRSITLPGRSISPSPTTSRPPPIQPPSSLSRGAKSRTSLAFKDASVSHMSLPASNPPLLSTSIDPPPAAISSVPPVSLSTPLEVAGVKRRHATMVLDSTAMAPPSGAIGRRRTRSCRGATLGISRDPAHLQELNQSQDAMDIEDEGGRERKRVARR